ncbi:MAG: DUF2142 domain-containing protein [Clostridium beijerinckii]
MSNNNILKKKNIIIIALAMILSICSILSTILIIESKKNVNYVITLTGDKNQNSKGSEVRISDIEIDGNPIELSKIELPEGFYYTDEQIVGFASDKVSILSINTQRTSALKITFIKHEWSGIVKVDNGTNIVTQDLYSNGMEDKYTYENYFSISTLLKDYLNNFIQTQKLLLFAIFTFSFLILYLCLKCVLSVVFKMKNRNLNIIDIVMISFSSFIIYFSSIFLLLTIFKSFIVVLILLILVILLYKLRIIINKKIEYIFLIFAMMIGIAMMFILPPFHVPDEGTHFVNSYYKSFLGDKKLTWTEKDGYIQLPVELDKYMDKYYTSVLDSGYKFSPEIYFNDFVETLDSREVVKDSFSFTNTKNLNVLPYIPSIVIIAVGRLIRAPIPVIFYMSRFIDLLIWIILGYYALHIIPRFKKVLFLVMLFPISLHQAIGINQDWLTNALFFLIIALLLREVFEKDKNKPVEMNKLIIILAVSIGLSFCKVVYFPVMLLTLLIPKERFKNKQQEYILKLIIMLPSMIISSWQIIFRADGLENIHVNNYTISYCLSHPLETVKIYIKTAFDRMPLDLLDGLNTGFGWSTKWGNSLNRFITNTIYIILILSFKEEDNFKLENKHRIIFLISSILIIALVYTSLLLAWTKFGYATIDGLQPRYFIPPVLLIYMACINKSVEIKWKNKNLVALQGIALTLTIALYTIISGYYF